MLLTTHLLFTFLLMALFWDSLAISWSYTGLGFFLLAILATLFPDIDNQKSALGRFFPAIGITFSHRGLFHTPVAALLLWLPLHILVSAQAGFAVFLGYLGHLVLDALSREGVVLLWPFSKRHFRGPVHVGSGQEYLIALGCALSILFHLISRI